MSTEVTATQSSLDTDNIDEARRQIDICNACRYCEGYCAVFPAITRKKQFGDGDVIQLANLCHNCRGCYYACQYTEPHEFALNVPKVLAEVRTESWERFAWPAPLARVFQASGVALAATMVTGWALLFYFLRALKPATGEGFYAYLSHGTMIALFIPAFVLPLIAVGAALVRYWRRVGGGTITPGDLWVACVSVTRLSNLSGGQGQGCNFENGDRFSNARRYAHQATLLGFALCFASTASGTVLHYVFDWPAPYPLLSAPKLFGVPGGLLLTAGSLALAGLKLRSPKELGAAQVWGGEMAFVLLMALTGASGLALYAAHGTALVPALLAIHLGAVLVLFVLTPYSKMVHGAFRSAALVREAQQVRAATSV